MKHIGKKEWTVAGALLTMALLTWGAMADPFDQIITFGALTNPTYGDAPLALSATASSGLPVSFAILSGPATLTGDILTITGAGSVTIEASQAGDDTYLPAPPVDQLLTVNQATLLVTADAKSKECGKPDPALTYQITSGALVTGDSLSGSLTRIPGESVGSYAILQGSLTAGSNYNLTFIPASLTIKNPMIDLNGDGMSDIWERMYNAWGLDPNGSASGDAISNLAKSIAGVESLGFKLIPRHYSDRIGGHQCHGQHAMPTGKAIPVAEPRDLERRLPDQLDC